MFFCRKKGRLFTAFRRLLQIWCVECFEFTSSLQLKTCRSKKVASSLRSEGSYKYGALNVLNLLAACSSKLTFKKKSPLHYVPKPPTYTKPQ
ncbi:hypothetical protein QWZ13_17520 [Reinekea marina]|uniref:hypothetical protein n=1 Tax=Reinekea marina TaxID=1310421 RepID=UPI0025B5505A|nr:hypothetical protein [Reinekea marina]MDN3650709.1 hypothetical protein [Reinekea marina]